VSDAPAEVDGLDAPKERKPFQALRGQRKDQLIRLLATKEHPQTVLAEMFGITQSGVSYFARRHREAIDAVAAKLDDEFAGLWIATKRARIAEYQQLVEDIEKLLDDSETRANVNYAEVARTKLAALKQASEELGQLPGRVTVQHSGGLDIRVNGVDVESLR
jgi:predicted transcriptional regulator